MRKVFRFEDNQDYWDRRWSEAGQDADHFADLTIYPIRYAEMVMGDPGARALEIGCGLGRVVKHYASQGFAISGIERSMVAVERLNAQAPTLDVRQGDVMTLPFADATFDVVMAFGLFHNLENGLNQALAETARCLRPGGAFAISMRPDNLESRLNEAYWRWRNRRRTGKPRFHKMLVGEREFSAILGRHGLRAEQAHYAGNMPILYRVPVLRDRRPGETEDQRRSRGYRLNPAGRLLQRALSALAPFQMCNVLVYVGRKEG